MSTIKTFYTNWCATIAMLALLGVAGYYRYETVKQAQVIEAQRDSIETLNQTIDTWEESYDDLDKAGERTTRRLSECRDIIAMQSAAHDRTYEKMQEYKALASELDKKLREPRTAWYEKPNFGWTRERLLREFNTLGKRYPELRLNSHRAVVNFITEMYRPQASASTTTVTLF